MDDIVRQAMAKWPNVPTVYGWLGLDRRGNWLIKGSPIGNPAISNFINRNYEHDADGRWYFQNGPQRVYVVLAYTPLVYRLGSNSDPGSSAHIESHTGRAVMRIESAWIDESGTVLLVTEHGAGVVDDRDLERLLSCFTDERGTALTDDTLAAAVERLQAGGSANLHFRYRESRVAVSAIKARRVALEFSFVARPAQPAGEEECI